MGPRSTGVWHFCHFLILGTVLRSSFSFSFGNFRVSQEKATEQVCSSLLWESKRMFIMAMAPRPFVSSKEPSCCGLYCNGSSPEHLTTRFRKKSWELRSTALKNSHKSVEITNNDATWDSVTCKIIKTVAKLSHKCTHMARPFCSPNSISNKSWRPSGPSFLPTNLRFDARNYDVTSNSIVATNRQWGRKGTEFPSLDFFPSLI